MHMIPNLHPLGCCLHKCLNLSAWPLVPASQMEDERRCIRLYSPVLLDSFNSFMVTAASTVHQRLASYTRLSAMSSRVSSGTSTPPASDATGQSVKLPSASAATIIVGQHPN
jgi:hypothetical protein